MLDPQRQRILGDVGDCASEHWWWGRDPAHVAVIIYGQTQGSFDALIKTISDLAARYGLEPIETIGMQPFDPPTNREPFGFRDGISQPVIRGTHKGMKHNDPMHLVEPGEFILGYPGEADKRPEHQKFTSAYRQKFAAGADSAAMIGAILSYPDRITENMADLVRLANESLLNK